MNGGPNENAIFDEAVSLSLTCEDQAEVDHYWNALTDDGGEPIMCGWLKDRYGLRRQVVPRAFFDMMRDKDAEKSRRVMEAMMQMVKLDVARPRDAYEG